MSEHVVKILDAEFINHNVKRFIVEKPTGYTFVPGQGTDVSINLPEWKDQRRPFTFTGLPKWEHLEFIIKIYPEHNGVTNMLTRINEGDELIINEPFGAIAYKGPGVFIAGGTGITPFISIFRDLYKQKKLADNQLIFSNRTSADIILGAELEQMLGSNYINVYTRENVIGYLDRHIDRDYLIKTVKDFGREFYVCGPDSFVKRVCAILVELGADTEALVIEK